VTSEQVNVLIDDLEHFSEVVERVRKAGLKVEQALEEVGVVSGSIDSAKLAALERLKGVAAVEPVRTVRIPPPEEDIQ
jgi:hypothetical protein